MKAGFAEVDITPTGKIELAGSFAPRKLTGVRDPLHVRSLVVESAGTTLALVSGDLLILPEELVTEVRAGVEAELGIPPAHTALFATHTHTGPFTREVFGHAPDEDYVKSLRGGIIEAIRRAHERRVPAELGVASAFEGELSFNRRWVMKDGRVRTHPPRGSHEISHVEGPMDPEVGILCFRGEGREYLGFVVNFACHPNVMRGTEVSADYPGALAQGLKRRYSEEVVTLFANGASGNICQIDVRCPDRLDSGPEWCDWMGETLSHDVSAALSRMNFGLSDDLAACTRVLSLARRHPDQVPFPGTLFGGETAKEVEALYERQQAEIRADIEKRPRLEIEMQFLRIGPAAIVMFPGELFVEIGLDLKLRSPIKPTFVVNLANGGVGYIPTRDAFPRGGYEVRTAWSSQFVPEAGDQIVEASLAALRELRRSRKS